MNLFDIDRMYDYIGDELPRTTSKYSPEEAEFFDKQKEIRRQVKLPITKALVYYKHPYHSGDKPIPVISFSAKKFVTTEGKNCDWYDVSVQIMGSDTGIKMHGDYFAEMQKPDFIEQAIDVSDEE